VRFLADMGVSLAVVRRLREFGHDAVHVRELGMQRSLDKEIFDRAAHDSRIIVTFDLDFTALAAANRSPLPSVIVLRLADARARQQADRLLAAIAGSEAALGAGAIIVVDDSRFRIRTFPVD
jgi:predicted nuclease of predicted toxin-antitoxin system